MGIGELVAGGGANPVFLVMMALVLGALHGLEPGHGKTMMAAYIVAVRGTVWQAALLGGSAAISHSIIVWVLAIIGLQFGDALIGEAAEPYFVMVSGLIVIAMGIWIQRSSVNTPPAHHHHHDHHHPHDHSHDHGPTDAHTLAHAREVEAQLASGRTTTAQTVMFGLSGGLVPCPAAITVLLICLQIGQFGLGMTLVAAFSTGLAVTLVAIGAVAALGLRYVSARSTRFDALTAYATRLSAWLIIALGVLMVYAGWHHLPHG
ncbi:MAG: nickel/cobalt efflux transporter [Pseudomonadota bacterium]